MMFDFSLSALAAQLGVAAPARDAVCTGVTTDSRRVRDGDLYVALVGERFDGHDFVDAALQAGACGVLVSVLPDGEAAGQAVLVADTLLALGQLSGWQRDAFAGTVVAITGSAGKTSTKQLMHRVLSAQMATCVTQGNLNNHIGAPLTLLTLQPDQQAAVIELGASGPGEIGYTAQWVRPHIGIITNAAEAHLEGFGSLDGVVETKGELIDFVAGDGTVVLNRDDPAFDRWQTRAGQRKVVSFGLDERADVRASDIASGIDGSTFMLEMDGQRYAASLPLPGVHNVRNALAVTAAARAAGMSAGEILQALASAVAVAGRMQPLRAAGGQTILDDSYNANPASVRAAIDVLSQAPCSWLVLGDMAELGEGEQQAHADIGRYAREQGVERLVATGPLSRFACEAFGDKSQWLPDCESVAEFIKQQAPDHAVVLVKGSRSAGMDAVVASLRQGLGE